MTLHYEDAGLRLWHGSNKEILPTFDAESFDSIVTDPPYELGFMGKGWDSTGIAYDVDVWRECWRVLKPGGFLLAFGGTRTWHRIAVAIEDAGFEIRDSIAWMYGSGFPKSMNVAKAIESHVTQGGSSSRMLKATELAGSGEPYAASGKNNGIMGETVVTERKTFEAESEAAREWEGWGTALKPAFEPIIVARKPLRGTVAGNVLVYGTGALNIDACRVPTTDALGGGAVTGAGLAMKSDGWSRPWMSDDDAVAAHAERVTANVAKAEALGRFPSNVVLSHSPLLDPETGSVVGDACAYGCVPGCPVAELDAQSGVLTSGMMRSGQRVQSSGGEIYGKRGEFVTSGATYGDSGGASRFFPTFRYEAKAPSSERPNVEGTVHATVKPLELMRWLIRLVTRRGGRVLDLYAGSGTTGEAALLEGCQVDLIELEADHLPLILQRVRKPLQPSMFGDWEAA